MIGRFVDGVGTLIVSGTKSASSVHPRNLRGLTESLRRMGSGGAFFWCLNRGVHSRPTNAGHHVPRLFMSANLARLFVPAIVPLFACRRWLASPGLAAGARIE